MTINCRGQLLDLKQPKVMGILNVTPDSFYDGGKYASENARLSQVEKMLSEGATFIDIGAYSSKPNVTEISQAEELSRLVPVIELVMSHFPDALISVDTFRSEVARIAIENGAAIINDISAGSLDKDMMTTISKYQVPYIMMHMKGTPQTMKSLAQYDDIVKEMLFYFSEKVAAARELGINDLVIDPGFGFAKTLNQNFEVLQKLDLFDFLDLPLLVGVSRKSMIYKPLDSNAMESLNGTTAVHAMALMKGANILRVHDVKPAIEAVTLFGKMVIGK